MTTDRAETGALRRVLGLVGLVAGSILVTLIVLEVVMFLFEPWLARDFQYDRELGFRVKPHAMKSNRYGFNDADYPEAKATGTYRILFIGDSFGWTGGLDSNYTALIEKKFEQLFGRHVVDVINTGYPMTQTAEQLILLRRYGMRYDPDLVVLGFFTGNDFLDANPYRKRIVLMDTYWDVDRRSEPPTFLNRPLVARSRLATFVKQRVTLMRELMARDSTEGLSHDAYLAQMGAQINFYNLRKHEQGEYDENVRMIFTAVDSMKALTERAGSRFAVAVFPSDYSVQPGRADTIFAHFGMNQTDYDLRLAQNTLERRLTARGIPFVDLQPTFAQAAQQRELYLVHDNHWNAAGSHLAADVVFEWLRPQVEAALKR